MAGAAPASGVAVIGGGWAGLAAGVTLAAAGVRVTLFEAAHTLGGRARRVAFDGVTVDNGQHLLLGAYRDTLALIRQVQPTRPPDELYARGPLDLVGPGAFRLRAARLPAPLHMVAGLLRARDCTIAERLAVVRAFARWRNGGWRVPPARTVQDLLAGQPGTMVDRLWTPLCLAALNTPPAGASAQVFLNVLRDALAGRRAASDLVIPATDLTQLFPDPAARYIEERGGAVRRGTTVRRLVAGAGAIEFEANGAAHSCSDVVVATAPWNAAGLLRDLAFAAPIRAQIDAYGYQPITTVYLRYDRPVAMPARMVQLGGEPGQWLFDRSPAPAGPAMLAVVISADGPHRRLAHADLARAVDAQLRTGIPDMQPGATLLWSRVITERRATHAASPGRMHPLAGHLGGGVHLAGDHTDADYPATLEAAVRSGIRAAHGVLERRRD